MKKIVLILVMILFLYIPANAEETWIQFDTEYSYDVSSISAYYNYKYVTVSPCPTCKDKAKQYWGFDCENKKWATKDNALQFFKELDFRKIQSGSKQEDWYYLFCQAK